MTSGDCLINLPQTYAAGCYGKKVHRQVVALHKLFRICSLRVNRPKVSSPGVNHNVSLVYLPGWSLKSNALLRTVLPVAKPESKVTTSGFKNSLTIKYPSCSYCAF